MIFNSLSMWFNKWPEGSKSWSSTNTKPSTQLADLVFTKSNIDVVMPVNWVQNFYAFCKVSVVQFKTFIWCVGWMRWLAHKKSVFHVFCQASVKLSQVYQYIAFPPAWRGTSLKTCCATASLATNMKLPLLSIIPSKTLICLPDVHHTTADSASAVKPTAQRVLVMHPTSFRCNIQKKFIRRQLWDKTVVARTFFRVSGAVLAGWHEVRIQRRV